LFVVVVLAMASSCIGMRYDKRGNEEYTHLNESFCKAWEGIGIVTLLALGRLEPSTLGIVEERSNHLATQLL
jgi:hypothetical protein